MALYDSHRAVCPLHHPAAFITNGRHPRSDRIADQLRAKLGLTKEQLTLAQVLESATWAAGREIAKEKRPESGGPPINILSDGTVF